ncbi:MAG TPA: FlgD immunoglobulin-like domain containing protein, partial [Candidatus Eisenbacteria bacterium]|nr:FlgD immunoglobulin-like domain containing protein [Candidatus Eisenbacteria bacterium]
CPTGSGFSGGGLDDRFDILLPTANLLDGHGMDFIVPTYVPVGNDGLHFNLNLTDAPTIPEGAAYANALWNASDHLPVRVDLMLPARASAPASLALGAAITGAVVGVPLAVANAAAPLDSLETLAYTITPDPGFTAPPGPETLREGEVAADAIGMDTGAPGVRSGSLFIATNDPDHPVLQVAVAGTVLRHAQASLDSAAAATQAVLDFGTHAAGGFTPLAVRVHDRGYDALQARLQLATATIAGGAGRFSLVPGGAPALIAGTGRTFSVAFDDAGATPDSTYTATLTFTGADEALPGAAPQPDLRVALTARPAGGGTPAATDAPPAATLLYAPAPNPLAGAGLVRFDLARAGAVALDVFDPSGRRVASIVHRNLGPGRYTFRWDGRTDAGRPLGAGLYFVRLTAPGSGAQTVRLALVR